MTRYRYTVEYGPGLKHESEFETNGMDSPITIITEHDPKDAYGCSIGPPNELAFQATDQSWGIRIYGHSIHSEKIERISD